MCTPWRDGVTAYMQIYLYHQQVLITSLHLVKFINQSHNMFHSKNILILHINMNNGIKIVLSDIAYYLQGKII